MTEEPNPEEHRSEANRLRTFSAPFHILRCLTGCWSCGDACHITAITAMYQPTAEERGREPKDTEAEWDHGPAHEVMTEPSRLCAIRSLPRELLSPLMALNPHFQLLSGHYQNTCGCGARQSDFHLFSQPGGAFFPMEEDHFHSIEVYRLEIPGPLRIDCAWGGGNVMGEILQKGKSMAPPA